MSIKLYNAWRFPVVEHFDLLQWQRVLASLGDELRKRGSEKLKDVFARRVLYTLDQDTLGRKRKHADKSPVSAVYLAHNEDARAVARGERRPTFDTGCEISWRLTENHGVLVLIFTEDRESRDYIVSVMGLEDYHYQNQVDPPEDVSEEDWGERYEVWEKALGDWNNPPSYRFHNMTLCEEPHKLRASPLDHDFKYHERVPWESRVEALTLDLLGAEEIDEAPGRDLFAKMNHILREAHEGGSLHARYLEIQSEVETKLIREPVKDDYVRVPGEE